MDEVVAITARSPAKLSASASVAVQNLKSNLRANMRQDRVENRHNAVDSLRLGVGELSKFLTDLEHMTEKDMAGMASRIKRRRRADEADLIRLSQSFLQCTENITTFTNITGALNVLVKELTGSDSNRQIHACECICNAALGSDNSCEKIALSAGSYLLMYADSVDQRLAQTSLWTLANLAVQPSAVAILRSQKLVETLLAITKPHLFTDVYETLEAWVINGGGGDTLK